jgi:hypothetical protein
VREADLDQISAERLQLPEGRRHSLLDTRFHPIDAVLLRHAEAETSEVAVELGAKSGTDTEAEVESFGSWPAIAERSIAASSTVRAKGPI